MEKVSEKKFENDFGKNIVRMAFYWIIKRKIGRKSYIKV